MGRRSRGESCLRVGRGWGEGGEGLFDLIGLERRRLGVVGVVEWNFNGLSRRENERSDLLGC
jgi:hypothetical protein